MAEPVKRVDMMGPMKLWNFQKCEWMQLLFQDMVHVPDSCNKSVGWMGSIAEQVDLLPAHASSHDS